MHRVHWDKTPYFKWGLCVAYGVTPRSIQYLETMDRRPGVWDRAALLELYELVTGNPWVVVGHNIGYDLGLLQDTFRETLGSRFGLPNMLYQDTMHVWKRAGGIKNNLKSVAIRQGVRQKDGGPDWDLVLQGDASEWAKMKSYCIKDVQVAFELEESFRKSGDPVPVKTWKSRKP